MNNYINVNMKTQKAKHMAQKGSKKSEEGIDWDLHYCPVKDL